MKKLFYLLAFFFATGIFNHSKAQCTISDLKLKLNSVNASTCEVNFDLSWTQEINSGNKYAYIHLWTEAGYHSPAANWANMYENPNAYPKAADLANVLATMVIDDNHSNNAFIGSVYHPDPSYTLPPQAGLSLSKVHLNNTLVERMTVQNITVTLPSCTGAQTILFDIWASQSGNGKNVHCATQGARIVINDVKVTGLIHCTKPPKFQVFIQNNGPALNQVQYHLYLDNPPAGVLDPSDSLVFTGNTINIPAYSTYISPISYYMLADLSYANAYLFTRPLLVEVTFQGSPNTIIATLQNSCGPLPVKFKDFTAVKAKDKVMIRWQTATELNNRGFEVQRRMPGGDFRSVAFVPSLAANGNSDLLLNYSYDDRDDFAGASQVFYRIKQIDSDGKSNFSETRFIKNTGGKISLLVYPNPSNGNVQVTMPGSTGPVDIILNDNTGKEVKRWMAVVTGDLRIDQLQPGIYVLTAFVRQTGERLMSKVVVAPGR